MAESDDKYDLEESPDQLREAQSEDCDKRAAALYRAMFRRETDLNRLDIEDADYILSYIESGHQKAVEDYKNYLRYIRKIQPSLYPAYRKMYEDAIRYSKGESEDDL